MPSLKKEVKTEVNQSVMPVKTGIQELYCEGMPANWIPASAGMTEGRRE